MQFCDGMRSSREIGWEDIKSDESGFDFLPQLSRHEQYNNIKVSLKVVKLILEMIEEWDNATFAKVLQDLNNEFEADNLQFVNQLTELGMTANGNIYIHLKLLPAATDTSRCKRLKQVLLGFVMAHEFIDWMRDRYISTSVTRDKFKCENGYYFELAIMGGILSGQFVNYDQLAWINLFEISGDWENLEYKQSKDSEKAVYQVKSEYFAKFIACNTLQELREHLSQLQENLEMIPVELIISVQRGRDGGGGKCGIRAFDDFILDEN